MDFFDERVLATLKDGKPRGFTALLGEVGFSHNTLQQHLERLMAQGLIIREARLQIRERRLLQRNKEELRASNLPPNPKIRIITTLHQLRDKPARQLKQFSKIVFTQHFALAYARTFICIKKFVFLVRRDFELKRVKPANQRTHRVNSAVILFQKDAFSVFCRLFHLVTVGRFTFNFHCELGDWLRSCRGNLFSLCAQKKNVPNPFLRVAATGPTLYASKAHGSRILKTHFSSRQNTVFTRTPIKTLFIG
jgi:DNA-binding Lrp family transcriptional regulator